MIGAEVPDGLEPLARLLLLSMRPLAALALLPPLAGAALPWRARLGLAVALAVFGMAHAAPVAVSGELLAGEALAGLVTGLGLAAAFAAATFAGETVGQMLGLGFAAFSGPNGGPTAVAGLYATLMWLALLTTGGLEQWFTLMTTAGDAPGALLDATAADAARLGAGLFADGVRLALPLVAVLLLGNLGLAVITRSAPQLGGMALGPVGLMLLMLLALPLVWEDLVLRAGDVLGRAVGG